ncbi:MAG TPA: hypothetical protein VJ978_10735 [Nitriliruptoraceae bacterium]|nr:hypothetical protein [Nitriliruptoraceae bacterium]
MALLGLAVLAAGCNGNGDDEPTQSITSFPPLPTQSATETSTPTPTPTPTPSPTPTTASPTGTPTPQPPPDPESLATVAEDGEVTVEEAQAILDAHLAIYNPAVIALLRTPDADLPPLAPADILITLTSIYTDQPANFFIEGWQTDVADGLPGLRRDDATGYAEEVVEVVGSDMDCIVLRVAQDFTGVAVAAEGAPVSHMELLKDDGDPPRNPTRWVRSYVAVEPAGEDLTCLG